MACYSGREGISFINAYAALGLAATIPLISTPLLTHDYWLPKMADAAIGVRTAFSWDTTARADEHERFRRSCKIGAGMDPAVFTLLGYETGRILCASVAGMEGAALGGETLRDALSAITFASPRGDMRLDEATGEVATVDYLQARRRQADGALTSTSLGVLELPPACQLDYETVRREDSRSGWLNPYLVT